METFSVEALKSVSNSQLGIELDILPGTNELIVTEISEESPLADADPRFQVGIQILQINQVNVQGSEHVPPMTPKQAVAVLLALPLGPVVLQCRGLVATAEKEFPETRVGIALQKNPFLGYVRVFSVSDTGLFARSGLLVGQRVTAVNGVICPPESLEAITRLKDAEGPISIVTVDCSGILTTSVQKSNLATLVGVKLRQKVSENEEEYEDIHVSAILPGALIANSGIKVGDKLISINGTPTPDNVFDSVEMMKQTVGTLVLETIPPSYGFSMPQLESDNIIPSVQEGQVLALVSKNHKSDKVGLLFREVPGENTVVIGDIAKDSMLTKSAIQRGMKVVSINAQACPSTPKEVVTLLSSLCGPIYIVTSYFRAVAVLSQEPSTLPSSPQELADSTPSEGKSTALSANLPLESSSEHQLPESISATPTQVDGIDVPQEAEPTSNSSDPPQLPNGAQVAPSKVVGLKLGQHKVGVVVQSIKPNSVFQGSDLRAGQTLVSINGTTCPLFANEAQKLVDTSVGSLCLEAAHVVPSMVPEWPSIGLSTVSLQREDVEVPIGINFGTSTLGRTVISSVEKDSPLIDSGLAIGMVVVSVNEEPCPNTPQEASEFVNKVAGDLKIVVARTVEIVESKPSCVIGLGLGRCPGGVIVHDISMDSIFYQGQLQAGHRILSINGEACPDDPERAMKAFEHCVEQIVVEAVDVCNDDKWPSDSLIPVKVLKAYASQYVGLRVQALDDSVVVITHVDEEGVFADGPIQPGMVVISVNGMPCPSSSEELTKIWNNIDGSLEVVVATFVHHIYNPKPESGFGFSLKKVNGSLVVSKIDPNGAASKVRAMKDQQRVIAINGNSCPSDLSAAISCIKADKKNLALTCVYPVQVPWSNDEELKFTVKKESASTPMGLILTDSDQGRVVVGAVCGGVCGDLAIESGLVVVAINGFSTFANSTMAMRFLADAIGDVTLIFAKTKIVLTNVSSDPALGLTVVPDPTRGVLIQSMVPGSPFTKTKLKVRQRITSLNGVDVSLDKFEMDMLKEGENGLAMETLDTFERHWSPGVMYSHTAIKQRCSTYVGVEFCTSIQKRLVVSRVDHKGLFASSKLASGQAIISVNGYVCKDAMEAAEVLSFASGSVTLVVADTYVSTRKNSIDDSIGVSFNEDDNGVYISKIRSESPLNGSALHLRHRLLSVNGKPSPSLARDVVALLKGSPGVISMVVRDTVALEWPMECLTTCVGSRESPERSYGVKFAAGHIGKIIIAEIQADGILAGTSLRTGQVVLYINDRPVPSSSAEANILLESSEFDASIVVADIHAKSSGSQLSKNLSLSRTARGVEVVKIEDGVLSPGSALLPKALIVSINGETCPSTVNETTKVLSQCGEEVALVAVDTPAPRFGWPDECLRDVIVGKDIAEAYIGLDLQTSEQGRVVVSWVDSSGLLSGSGIIPGDVIVAINGETTTSVTEAFKTLVSVVGNVCLVLARTVAVVEKTTQGCKMGIKLKGSPTHGVVVYDTRGLTFSTLLKKGQQLLSINNEPCPDTLSGTIQKLQESEGVVRIDAIDTFEKSWYEDAVLSKTSVDLPDEPRFWGIHLRKSLQGRIVICSVEKQSVFHSFDLVGKILVSINDHACPKNAMDAVEMLHSARKRITLVTARTVAHCTIDPAFPHDLGLSLGKTPPHPDILITKIEDDSPFCGTCLRSGQKVVQIAGKQCPQDLESAVEAIGQAVQEGGTFSIETADLLGNIPIGEAIYTVVKPFKESMTGVWLKRSKQDRVAVSQIDPNGLFAKTGLKVGQSVVNVNGVDVSDDVHLTVKQIQRAQRVVSIVARSIVIKVVKPSRNAQVGITLANIGGNVIVRKVFPSGILADTELNVGQRVVNVNGVDAVDVHSTIQLIRDVEGTLEIEAVDSFYESVPIPEGASLAPMRRNASAWKIALDTIVGISVKDTPEGVVITKVSSDGLFANSAVQTGQKIVGINGSICPPTAAATAALLKSLVGGLVLSTETTFGSTI
eukprot:Nitzschia sp. Nitz4//scaffold245_size28976//5406//11384//NITZ4_008071-RA/size28976-processed-gene-0.18-mRNA-1//-1//CDS//3329543878//9242//frame0